MEQSKPEVTQVRLLSFKQVQDITGMSRSTIYRQVKSGDFPRPMLVSQRRVGFLSYELQIWLDAQRSAA